jgi:hypothetical protein
METYISTIAYEEDFKTMAKTGWGCGYVHIPKDHPILVETLIENGWGNYLQPKDCPQEITFSSWTDDKEYFIIGFDTAHSWNNASHDEEYITQQTNAIKALVDAYTADDAHKYAMEQVISFKLKFSKYLYT